MKRTMMEGTAIQKERKPLRLTSLLIYLAISLMTLGYVIMMMTSKNYDHPTHPVNQYRITHNLQTLKHNVYLDQSAQEAAEQIALFQRGWSHDGYQQQVIKYYGKDYTMIGENLAKDFSTLDEVVKAWDASPTHQENLQTKTACEFGFGQYERVYVLHLGCK